MKTNTMYDLLRSNPEMKVKIKKGNELYHINDFFVERGSFIVRNYTILPLYAKKQMDLSYGDEDEFYETADDLADAILDYINNVWDDAEAYMKKAGFAVTYNNDTILDAKAYIKDDTIIVSE